MTMRKMYTELGHKGTEKQKLHFFLSGTTQMSCRGQKEKEVTRWEMF